MENDPEAKEGLTGPAKGDFLAPPEVADVDERAAQVAPEGNRDKIQSGDWPPRSEFVPELIRDAKVQK